MTRSTSSRSAKAIQRMVVEAVVSGTPTPPTDPLYASTFDELLENREAEGVTVRDWRYAVWSLATLLKHLVGWHTFVPLEEWDVERGSMQYVGMVCWRCPERHA